MSNIELRIYFLDLLAFVRDGSNLWVLLRDARISEAASDKTPLDPHYPIVLFDTPGGLGNDWPVIETLLRLTGSRPTPHAWLLNGEEVSVPIQNAEAGFTILHDAPGVYPVRGQNDTHFGWVPKMRSISPQHSQVDADCIRGSLPSAKVAARLKLTQGRIESFEFCKFIAEGDDKPKIHSFEFRKLLDPSGISRFAKALTEVAVARIWLDGSTVELKTSAGRKLTLASNDGKTINVLLANLSPVDTVEKEGKGRHFELYYKLSSAMDPVGGAPFLGDDPPQDPQTMESPLPAFFDAIDTGKISTSNRPICSFVEFAPPPANETPA